MREDRESILFVVEDGDGTKEHYSAESGAEAEAFLARAPEGNYLVHRVRKRTTFVVLSTRRFRVNRLLTEVP